MPGISSEKELEQLVNRLNNPGSAMGAYHEIIKRGKTTLHPLVEFLLSPPSIFSEPRCLAAEALGIIGGEEAILGLIEVLDLRNLDSLDPQVRLAEETVRDEAARQLAILRDERATQPLLKCLKDNHLRGAAEALGIFGEKRAIPEIIEMLEDDYARETACNALLKFDKDAVPPLTEALSRRNHSPVRNETRLSKTRRTEATRLLGRIGDPRAIQPLLERLEDEQQEIRTSAALSLTEIGLNGDSIKKAIPELIAGLNGGDW